MCYLERNVEPIPACSEVGGGVFMETFRLQAQAPGVWGFTAEYSRLV